MKLLVTGGRNFTDRVLLDSVLDQLHAKHVFTHVIHGAATGADMLADEWCNTSGVQPVACRALWDYYRAQDPAKARGAGPIRNHAMLALAPDLVVVFPGGTGTLHMASIAERAGFKVVRALELEQTK
jgi:hypothetical protein